MTVQRKSELLKYQIHVLIELSVLFNTSILDPQEILSYCQLLLASFWTLAGFGFYKAFL